MTAFTGERTGSSESIIVDMVGATVPISVSTLSVIDSLPAPNRPFPLKGLPLVVEGYESGSRSCLTDYPVVVL
jgi:hypothetical protein